MKKLMKGFHKGESGVTLIELLIVLAILGIIATVIVLNVGGFSSSGNLAGARTELENVQSAIAGYFGDNGVLPADDTHLNTGVLSMWISGTLKADYVYDSDGDTCGVVGGVYIGAGGHDWGTEVTFDNATQEWNKV